MKKSKVKRIEDVIKDECARQGIPYSKRMLRRGKKVYYSIPSTRRHLVGLK